MKYEICKLSRVSILELKKVSDILYLCGKDMAKKYDLHHWDNSYIKNWVIVLMCAMKNEIYLVYCDKKPVATFQTHNEKNALRFQKLATVPEVSGAGIGSFCLQKIEGLARKNTCDEVFCEVYDKSEYAKIFYEHRGYTVYGTTETLKYSELKMKKIIR